MQTLRTYYDDYQNAIQELRRQRNRMLLEKSIQPDSAPNMPRKEDCPDATPS
jgi:hypothetical protein